MKHMIFLFMAACLLSSRLTGPANATDAEDLRSDIQGYVRLLSEGKGEEAKSAFKKVIDLGDAAIPCLEDIVRTSQKNESVDVARRLLHILKRHSAEKELNLDGKRVNLDAGERTVTKLLDELELQTDNKIDRCEFNDNVLNLSFKDATFWEALDTICRESDNIFGPDPDRTGG